MYWQVSSYFYACYSKVKGLLMLMRRAYAGMADK